MKEVSLFDAKTHFSSIIQHVDQNHQEYLITRHGKRVAKIIPFAPERKTKIKLALKKLQILQQEINHKNFTIDEINKMKSLGRK